MVHFPARFSRASCVTYRGHIFMFSSSFLCKLSGWIIDDSNEEKALARADDDLDRDYWTGTGLTAGLKNGELFSVDNNSAIGTNHAPVFFRSCSVRSRNGLIRCTVYRITTSTRHCLLAFLTTATHVHSDTTKPNPPRRDSFTSQLFHSQSRDQPKPAINYDRSSCRNVYLMNHSHT